MTVNRFTGQSDKTTAQYHSVHMSTPLFKVATKVVADDMRDKKAKAIDAKADKKRPHSQLTDAQILEGRALFEFAGWVNKRIASHMNLDLETVKRITSGRTGAKLFATVKHLPAGVEPLVQPRRSR